MTNKITLLIFVLISLILIILSIFLNLPIFGLILPLGIITTSILNN